MNNVKFEIPAYLYHVLMHDLRQRITQSGAKEEHRVLYKLLAEQGGVKVTIKPSEPNTKTETGENDVSFDKTLERIDHLLNNVFKKVFP